MSEMPEIFQYYTRYDQLGLSDIHEPITKALEFAPVGDYYEFGLYAGSNFYWAQQESKRMGLDMNFWGFDSFEGLPTVQPDEVDSFVSGSYAASLELVEGLHKQFGYDEEKVHFIKGWFNESLTPTLAEERGMKPAAVVLVDCDLYQSTVPVLNFIRPLLQRGTIILFDDWGSFPDNRGERRAFNEFLQRNPEWATIGFLNYNHNGHDRYNGKAFVMVKI